MKGEMLMPLAAIGLILLLLRAETVMSAASMACRLFVTAVMPGLLPYMVLSLMAVSRVRRLSPALLMLLGWGGGSPTGARLLALCPKMNRAQRIRIAITCATMSPMFLAGTIRLWLNSSAAGWTILLCVLLGGWLTGLLYHCSAGGRAASPAQEQSQPPRPLEPLTFGEAVEQAARTMLLVCGTMVMLRVFLSLAAEAMIPSAALIAATLLEVTTGTQSIAALPLPLPLKTALIAGATGFGGMAVIMQNRTLYTPGFMPLWQQVLWQSAHGAVSFLLALGAMGMIG